MTAVPRCRPKGTKSDCILKPVALYPDAARKDGYIVLSEVMHPDGTPHPTNARATIENDPDLWIGFEQEYFLYKDGRPLGFPAEGYPGPQGPYYCGVGYKYMGNVARQIVDEHLDLCLAAGINHEGINAEVAKGQWEFQIFAKGSAKAADDTWTARYLMARLCEKYEVDFELYCKPIKGDWNGSGMHTNFSTKYMREVGGKEYFESLMAAFEKNIPEHIAVYGPDNHLRLTGLHETQAIDKFSYRPLGPRRFHPHARELHQERLQGLPGRSPPELRRRPLPDRLPHPEDDQHRPQARNGRQRRLSLKSRGAAAQAAAHSPLTIPHHEEKHPLSPDISRLQQKMYLTFRDATLPLVLRLKYLHSKISPAFCFVSSDTGSFGPSTRKR